VRIHITGKLSASHDFFKPPDRSWPGYALNACSANRPDHLAPFSPSSFTLIDRATVYLAVNLLLWHRAIIPRVVPGKFSATVRRLRKARFFTAGRKKIRPNKRADSLADPNMSPHRKNSYFNRKFLIGWNFLDLYAQDRYVLIIELDSK
jgi:hypothetical protein